MNFATNNQPITTFPLSNLSLQRLQHLDSLGHQPPSTAPTPEPSPQIDLMEAITTILDNSTWFEEKLEKRMEEITNELKDDIEELVERAVDDAIDNAIRGLDLSDHIDVREVVKQAVHEELNDTLSDEINNLLENASVTISV